MRALRRSGQDQSGKKSAAASIRTVLIAGMLAVALVPALLIGVIGVAGIGTGVRSEAQSRVNHDLEIVAAGYREELVHLASSLEAAAARLAASANPAETLAAVRRELDLAVLNLCDVDGRSLAGSYPGDGRRVPLEDDPVLGRALAGKPAFGSLVLGPERLLTEGGVSLLEAAAIPRTGAGAEPTVRSGLMGWAACPVRDGGGRVAALLYGGRLINFNDRLVDKLSGMVFSDSTYQGKPLGTVTIFLGDVRAATNVRAADGARAVGSQVSDAVRRAVLEQGGVYTGEAWVVDAWYLSAYAPLRDPGGATIGMLYVGLLRAPYDDMRLRLISRFLVPAAGVGLLAVAAALFIVSRITRPLNALGDSAARLAGGDGAHVPVIPHTYSEIETLARAFDDMREAVHKRDRELRARNEQLETSNRNYMQTLGFVTHELKAPLAAVQMLAATVVDGYLGRVAQPLADVLVRIQRNCEELQDMVRDYLDLSRLERGHLAARPYLTRLPKTVVEPAVDQTAVFFRSRNIAVDVDCPGELAAVVDPELMRIALNNLLTNAAKYGREGGRASVTVRQEGGQVRLSVWNEGEGFPADEASHLFEKFFRLKNANTYAKRGSGLGLFTVREIVELHGGSVRAESVPGAWAAFHLSVPSSPPATVKAGTAGP
jgi:two-component system NtrC family sensor kinase